MADNKNKNTYSKVAKGIMIGIAVIVFAVLPFVIEPRPQVDDYDLEDEEIAYEEEPTEAEEPTFNNTKSVYLGYYHFYMPEGTEFEYYDECMTATTGDKYGAICYTADDAPETSEAVYDIYGIKNPEYFESDHDVNGAIVKKDDEDGTHMVAFCITYDGLFHCIEVWLNDGVSDKAWQTIFSSVELATDYNDCGDYRQYFEDEMRQSLVPDDVYSDYYDEGYIDYDGSLRGGWR